MKENPYFAKAGAPKIEQENNDKAEQSGSYSQGKNDKNVQVESEEGRGFYVPGEK